MLGEWLSCGIGDLYGLATGFAGIVSEHCADPSQAVRRVAMQANDHTLLAIELSLKPRGFGKQTKQWLANGRVRGALAPLEGMLAGQEPGFRDRCIAQLAQARGAGVFSLRLDNQPVLLASGQAKVDALRAGLDDLNAQLSNRTRALTAWPDLDVLLLQPAPEQPLLVVLFNFFLEQALLRDEELRELLRLMQLQAMQQPNPTDAQQARLAAVGALLERLPDDLAEAFSVIAAQVRAESEALRTEVRGMLISALGSVSGATLPRLSEVIQDPQEQRLVQVLLARYRALPMPEPHPLPDLPKELGSLQLAIGNPGIAETLYLEAQGAGDVDSMFQRFRLYLEAQRWPEAGACLLEAAATQPPAFVLFPVNKYELIHIIGCGGFGVAMLCRHRHLGHQVVIKAPLTGRSKVDAELIVREGRILKGLRHPGIIGIEDADYADDDPTRPYLVLEYFPDSCSLARWVETSGPLPLADAQAVALAVAEALAAAHGAGLLHRDVTPENLLVRREADGRIACKLIDFGLAARRVGRRGISERFQDSLIGNSAIGKLDYSAPEQQRQDGKIGYFTDVFGFGRTLCFALFNDPTPNLLDWERVGQHHPLVRLLNRCIQGVPDQRPPDFQEVLEGLARRDTVELVVDGNGDGAFRTLVEALAVAGDQIRILLRPGRYQGPIRIDRPLELVGDGPAEQVILSARGGHAIHCTAPDVLIANLTIRQEDPDDWCALCVPAGQLTVENCDISSRGSTDCVIIAGDAEALLTRVRIHDSAAGGVLVHDRARCGLSFSQVYGHRLAGLAVQDQGHCEARGNALRDNRRSGVLLCGAASAALQENAITDNRAYGVVVKGEARLTARYNRIRGNGALGIAVLDGATCNCTGNDLTGNQLGAWHVPGLQPAQLCSLEDNPAPDGAQSPYA